MSSSSQLSLAGSMVALVTPMLESGDIDFEALDGLLEWHIDCGTNAIVPTGTTGESATLTPDEHLAVIKRTVDVVAGRIPVIAGTGANATSEAIEYSQAAQSCGADACLSVTPYYNRPPQEGMYRHYKAIAQAIELPLILYNVPPRTASDLLPDTVARLAEVDNIVGIKEACGDAERVAALRGKVPDDFVILSGEDAQNLRMFELGAQGAISVTANVRPLEMAQFCRAWLEGDVDGAQRFDDELQSTHRLLFIEPSPMPTKWALAKMGRIQPGIRLPLIPLSEQGAREVGRHLLDIGVVQ